MITLNLISHSADICLLFMYSACRKFKMETVTQKWKTYHYYDWQQLTFSLTSLLIRSVRSWEGDWFLVRVLVLASHQNESYHDTSVPLYASILKLKGRWSPMMKSEENLYKVDLQKKNIQRNWDDSLLSWSGSVNSKNERRPFPEYLGKYLHLKKNI